MSDREKVIKGLKCCDISNVEKLTCFNCPYVEINRAEGMVVCTARLAHDALELLNGQDALLNKIYDAVSEWGLDSPCDDLVCDDGWCEEHCERDGTKPECIERWFKYLLKKGGEVDD